MELTTSLKRTICSLFEVHSDENGVQRIVTPLEYSGSGDKVVIRVRPSGDGFQVDENGDAALYASMADGEVESEAVNRWAGDLCGYSPVSIGEDGVLFAITDDAQLLPSYIFRVAEAAQQLYALTTSRHPRRASQLKAQVAQAVHRASQISGFSCQNDVSLPIAGGFVADHLVESEIPLIVIAATGIQRLLEAEIIHMQYRLEKAPGIVIAAVESQKSVGAKQFERANYYTGKTVAFNPDHFETLIKSYAVQ